MERNQKTLRKQKKHNIWKLLVRTPPWPRSLEYCFFWFSQKFLHFWPENQKHRENKKNNKKYLETLGGTPPSPRHLEYCFFCFCFFWFSRCFCWFVPIPHISKTVRIFVFVVLFFVFRDKIQLFYVLNAFSPVAITSSQSLPHWSSVLQHGPGALYFSSRFATKSHEETTVLACLRACVRACVLACLRACVHECVPACVPAWPAMPACLRACVPACLRACVPACLRACVPACLRACVPACLRACVPAFLLSCFLACFLACLLACLLHCLLACLPPCRPCSPSVLHSSKQ